ncbi:lycopene cyclase domain-containing protein [Mycetocola sp.]|uniref:lycopene cyclase domain-containing protein n=1 Tax=Mycetocola sp. TaxID=1871042 RepID=UPI00398A107E
MSAVYLFVLLASIGCMVLLDRRFALFFWRDARRAGLVLAAGVLFFVLWDLSGIGLGIFYRGETDFMTGIVVAPELPVEELFFLAFLSYLTMVLLTGTDALLRARAVRR